MVKCTPMINEATFKIVLKVSRATGLEGRRASANLMVAMILENFDNGSFIYDRK